MRIASRRDVRALRIESLENRELMSVVPPTASVPVETGAAVVTAVGDTVIPIHAQIGGSALEKILGVAVKIDALENVLNAYLNEVPGWHVTGGIDTTPEYFGMIDGSVVLGADGMLKSASVALTGSADIGGCIEGYYGISVLHVGVGAAVDLSANVSAFASYSVDTNDWDFSGSASMVGYVKGYASAMAWPLKGEVYVKGDLTAGAAINSDSGIASANVSMVGAFGANAQLKNLFGGWKTIASVSRNLGSCQYSTSFDVGAWIQSAIGGVAAANQQLAKVNAVAAVLLAQTKDATSVTTPSVSASVAADQAGTIDSLAVALVAEAKVSASDAVASVLSGVNSLATKSTTAKVGTTPAGFAASVHASALQQLSATWEVRGVTSLCS